VDRIAIDLDNEPKAAGEVAGATDLWPVSPGDDTLNDKIEVESQEHQHANRLPSWLSRLALLHGILAASTAALVPLVA
jgi:hypothetical protein